VIKYSAQIVEAGWHGDGADGLGAGDGDNKGVSGGSRDVVRDIEGLGGGSFERGVRGVRRGGPGMKGNRHRASARLRECCLEDEHGVNEVLLYSEGVPDVELFKWSGRLWWRQRGGFPGQGDTTVETLPGRKPGSVPMRLGGQVLRSNSGIGHDTGSVVGERSLKLKVR
jgi:hypothetical protein